jgi:diadenosine tetraphosphate (Ap4A) HIT family hydrolase
MTQVNVTNARSEEYANELRRIQADKVCPFCEEHLLTYHKKPIIATGAHWVLTENDYPYDGAVHHLLIISRKHVEHFEEISSEAQQELFALFTQEVRERGIKGGTILMRFGETNYTGGSVSHLHAQLITGTEKGDDTEALITSIGNKKKTVK